MREKYGDGFYLNRLKRHRKIYAIAKDFDFRLNFNKNDALYEWVEEQPDETNNKYIFELAKMLGSGHSIFYQNKKDNLILAQFQEVGTNSLFRETSSLNKYQWDITQETDTILVYPVIKAVSRNVEVWFTPTIPVPFGPAGYGGLPGLILKKRYIKQFPAYELVATEIRFYRKPIKIEKPKKGILRTEKEGRAARIKAIDKM